METFWNLMHGFALAMQPQNLLFATLGCFLGTLIGVLPGIGPAGGMAILIPVTFVLDPTSAIIMLASMYYGACFGGTITAVLVNVPGEATSAITCIEGYEMAKRGRAGPALFVAAIGSFAGGTVATLALVMLAAPLTELALTFGPPEFFALMFVGLSLVTSLAGKSMTRALMSAMFGLLAAMVGIDPVMGGPRLAFGQAELLDGFGIVPVAMGMFGVGEILLNAEGGMREIIKTKLSDLWMSRQDWKDSFWPIVRGTLIGIFFGLIPGIGGIVSSFIAYVAEKKTSRYPERFGTGLIEGVAGPETANNSHANAAFIPLFTLGVPPSATMAILMGALMMNGLTPGPMLFKQHGDFVWAVIASFYIGNVILLVMNLPLIPMWVAVLKIPYSIMYGLILGFCVIGAYSLDNSLFDVGAMLGWGIVGYIFRKLDIPLAPLILTLILGRLMERGLRQSLEISQGDMSVFFTRPISGLLMAIGIAFILIASMQAINKVRGQDSQL